MSALMLAAEVDICPSCLALLPDGYEFDHVAVDRAAAGDRTIFAAMSVDAKAEAVITALGRGTSLSRLAKTLNWPYRRLQELLPDGHPNSFAAESVRNEREVQRLWEKGLPDTEICAATGLDPTKVGRIRKRLGLAMLRRGKWYAIDENKSRTGGLS